jgi:Putative ATPase subunit of terminase (gpP-like).
MAKKENTPAKKPAKKAVGATLRGRQKASPAEISHAETLYCEKKWSPEAIAETLDRDIKTIYSWRDKYHWEETRDLFDTGPTELKKILLKEAVRITKGEKRTDFEGNELPNIDSDSLSKVMKAYDYLSKKASPSVCRDIFMEFDNWLSNKEPKLAADMTQYHKQFLIYKIQQENGN